MLPVAVGRMFQLSERIFGAFVSVLAWSASAFWSASGSATIASLIYTLAVVGGWVLTGLPMILHFAGIGDVPKETFDAAKIEGRGTFG